MMRLMLLYSLKQHVNLDLSTPYGVPFATILAYSFKMFTANALLSLQLYEVLEDVTTYEWAMLTWLENGMKVARGTQTAMLYASGSGVVVRLKDC